MSRDEALRNLDDLNEIMFLVSELDPGLYIDDCYWTREAVAWKFENYGPTKRGWIITRDGLALRVEYHNGAGMVYIEKIRGPSLEPGC